MNNKDKSYRGKVKNIQYVNANFTKKAFLLNCSLKLGLLQYLMTLTFYINPCLCVQFNGEVLCSSEFIYNLFVDALYIFISICQCCILYAKMIYYKYNIDFIMSKVGMRYMLKNISILVIYNN